MKQTDETATSGAVMVPADADVADQGEDDQPEECVGEDVAYDLDAPIGGA